MKRWIYTNSVVDDVNTIPAGYLRTTKFTAPSIRSDDQRNALEALEIAIMQKFKQFESMCDRTFYLTSSAFWQGTIYQYEEGYYIQLDGTRSNFSAFVKLDSVIRKPRYLGELIARYDVEGENGEVSYLSRNRLLQRK